MLVSIAFFTAGIPLAAVVQRLILQFSARPVKGAAVQGDGGPRPRLLPWQTARGRERLSRAVALSLPFLLLATATRFALPHAFIVAIVVLALVVCAATDLLGYRVPDVITLPALALVLAAAATGGGNALLEALIAALLASGLFLLVTLLTRGGLGGGDIKLAALIGAALGLPGAAFALAAGIVAGSLVVIALHALRALERDDGFPYAPFLSLAALLVLFLQLE